MSRKGERSPEEAGHSKPSASTALIISGLGEEPRAKRTSLDLFEQEYETVGIPEHFVNLPRPPQWQVVLVEGRAEIISGPDSRTMLSQLRETFRPTIVIATGAAASLSSRVELGDVVVASQLSALGNGNGSSGEKIVVPAVLRYLATRLASSGDWRSHLQAPAQDRPPHAYIAPLLLTNRPIEHMTEISAASDDALAVASIDWQVVQDFMHNNVPLLVVQAIAQEVDRPRKHLSWRQLAARHSSAYAIEFLHRLDPEVLGGWGHEMEQWSPELPYDVGQEGYGPARRLEELPPDERAWFETAFAEQDHEITRRRKDPEATDES
jgi:nucleoside phosphorylase